MFYKLTEYFKPNSRSVCLSEMDCLYKDIISDLAMDTRTTYCQRLIDRTKYDLENTREKEKRKALGQILMAAEQEIHNLTPNKSSAVSIH